MHVPIVGIVGPRAPLKVAVQAAIDAHAKTGRMLDSALAYAAHGYPVFPLDERSKAPVPRRDKDAHGNKIPRTGGFYKATYDQDQIRKWWKRKEHLIGMPMGPRAGVWALDVDTAEDHADGMAAWEAIIAEHGAIETREHLTATNGLHLIFNWHAERPIGCSRGSLPDGTEVKGRGGYIVAPPSRRKGRDYRVGVDINPISAPDWLIEMIGTRPVPQVDAEPDTEPQPDSYFSRYAAYYADDTEEDQSRSENFKTTEAPVDLDELADALRAIPNDNLPWDEWTTMGLAVFAATGGLGFELFDEWSRRSTKYDSETTLLRWEGIEGSPPNRIGAGYIFNRAVKNGWRVAPTPQAASFDELDAARQEVQRIACEFLQLNGGPQNVFERYTETIAEFLGFEATPPTVWAMKIDTGVGKTKIVVEEIAKKIAGSKLRAMFAVPTLRLGEDIVAQFMSHGVSARLFRGRMASDPEHPGEMMCLNLDAVELAMEALADINRTCCKFKKARCDFFDQCGYQRQLTEKPQVWVVASDMIFHTQAKLGKPAVLIVDEALWQKALRGIEDAEKWIVPLASLANGSQARRDLADELAQQEDDGGLQHRIIEEMDIAALSRMISVEWAQIPKFNLRPGMPREEFERLKRFSQNIAKIIIARRIIQILEELRHMLAHPEIEVSGRLLLEERNGQRVIRWRGVAPISKQFKVPTLLIDATLPDPSVLKVLHPQVEIVADIRVAMPSSVHIRQQRDAPTSSRKLINVSGSKKPERHLEAVRRYVLQRWFETGKQSTLVICQMKVAAWLKDKLPDTIKVAHYNAIAGLDAYKDVRLLILVGRVQPGPDAVEALAATLSGSMPVGILPGPQGFAWYRQIRRGIRLKDGSGVAVIGDQHPDDFCESVRQLITEAELVQALGRARAVNRTKQAPLDVDFLFDTCLPVTVDEVSNWTEPSLLIETAIEGVMLESPVDMVRVWPTIWRNTRAADRSLARGVPALPGFDQLSYQLDGAKMKPRIAYFDRELIPDPRAWLEERLGLLRKLSR